MVDNPWSDAKREEKFKGEKNPFRNLTFNKKIRPEDETGVSMDDIPERVNIATQNTFLEVNEVTGMTFLKLDDTPSLYSNQKGKSVVVNSDEDGLTFTTIVGSYWTKIGSTIHYKKGYVGIGLVNPAFDLDVSSNINYTGTVYYGGSAFIQQPADRNLLIGVGVLGAGNHGDGDDNIALGLNALYSLTIGDKNVGIGVHALYALTTDSRNTCVGYYAGASFTTLGENTCFGAYAGGNATSENGTFVGYQAGYSGSSNTGTSNTYVGRQAGASNTSGHNNACFGHLAGTGITQGAYNTCIGRSSGGSLTTGAENTLLGYSTSVSSGGINYSIAIGTQSQCTASNQMVIGSTGRAITDVYISEGVTNATPIAFTLQTTGATGSNNAGADFNLAGGKATGNAASGEIVFKTSTAGGSGSTLQSLAEIARVGTGGIYIKNQNELRFYDNGNYVGFEAPALGADQIWVLPATDGSNLYFLQTDSNGNLIFASGISGIGADEINDTHIDWGLGANQVNADDMPYTSGETVNNMFDESLNSGLMHDCTITDTGGLGISWPASQIFDASVDSEVDTNSGSGTCTDNLTNYLIWAGGATLTLGTSPPDDSANEIGIAHIVCMGGDIWAIHQEDRIFVREYEISGAMGQMFPAIVTDGLIVSEDADGTNAFDLTISTGVYYVNGHLRKSVTGFNSRATNLVRWYHSSGAWTSDTNHSISNTQWDDPAKIGGQGLETVSSAKYYAHLIFLVESTIHVVYPDAEYNTIAQAIAGGGGNKPPGFHDEPLVMCVILKGNDAALPTAGGTRWIDLRPLTTGSVNAGIVTDHGNLSGLADEDHSAYIPHSLAGAVSDFLVASGANVYVKKTLAETGAILEADIQHDNLQGVTSNEHIDWTNATQNFSTQGSIDVNDNGSSGETGIDFNSISSTFSIICQSDAEGIAASSDLRIGLDESNRMLIICDRGDIGADFNLAAQGRPSLHIMNATGTGYGRLDATGFFWTFNMTVQAGIAFTFLNRNDVASGSMVTFNSSAGAELTDANGQQSWMYIEPKVNQTNTAAFDGIYVNGTLTSVGDGSTGDGNNYLRLATSGTTVFRIDTTGGIHPDGIKSGTDQADAGAAAGELYQDTNDDNTIKIGV